MHDVPQENTNESTSRVEQLKSLVEGEPQALFILVGAMTYNNKKERYESGNFTAVDENSLRSTGKALATGGKDRVYAAAELSTPFPEMKIVAMSKTRDSDKPTYAAVAKYELEQKGVDGENIILEEESVSTITEYKEAAKLWHAHRTEWNNLVFLSSNWHLPRCKALFNHIENFADSPEEAQLLTEFADAVRSGELKIQFIGSTDVLQIRSRHYKPLFDALEEYQPILDRIEQEQKALKQIADDTYDGRQLTKHIW